MAARGSRPRVALAEKWLFDRGGLVMVVRRDMRPDVVVPAPIKAGVAITAHAQLHLVLVAACAIRLVRKPVSVVQVRAVTPGVLTIASRLAQADPATLSHRNIRSIAEHRSCRRQCRLSTPGCQRMSQHQRSDHCTGWLQSVHCRRSWHPRGLDPSVCHTNATKISLRSTGQHQEFGAPN